MTRSRLLSNETANEFFIADFKRRWNYWDNHYMPRLFELTAWKLYQELEWIATEIEKRKENDKILSTER